MFPWLGFKSQRPNYGAHQTARVGSKCSKPVRGLLLLVAPGQDTLCVLNRVILEGRLGCETDYSRPLIFPPPNPTPMTFSALPALLRRSCSTLATSALAALRLTSVRRMGTQRPHNHLRFARSLKPPVCVATCL